MIQDIIKDFRFGDAECRVIQTSELHFHLFYFRILPLNMSMRNIEAVGSTGLIDHFERFEV
jgi:hypothetical protein